MFRACAPYGTGVKLMPGITLNATPREAQSRTSRDVMEMETNTMRHKEKALFRGRRKGIYIYCTHG